MAANFDKNYPSQYEGFLTLKNGKEIFVRPIRSKDEPLIVDLSQKLSARSFYLRFLWRVHAIPKDLLYRFTHVNYVTDFALVAVIEEDSKESFIAVCRYMYNLAEDTTELALVVRDDWQNLGLGKSLLAKTVAIGKENDISRFKTIMDPRNDRMRCIFRDLGYDEKSTIREGLLELDIFV
jgi:acetyltransferase